MDKGDAVNLLKHGIKFNGQKPRQIIPERKTYAGRGYVYFQPAAVRSQDKAKVEAVLISLLTATMA